MTFHFDPSDPSFIEDPYPTYKALRDEHPAYRDEASGCWVISRYQDVARILIDTTTFSSAKGNTIIDSPLRVGKTLGSIDPPRHDELRRVIMRGVTPQRIEAMLPALRAHTRQVMETLGSQRNADVVADIGRPILYGALGRMLGLDDEAAEEAVDLARDLFNAGLGPYCAPLTPQGFRAVFDFLGHQAEKRKFNRGDDLISLLINAQEAGASLNDQEIVANMTVVLLAGNASIGHYFTNLIYALWRNPDQRKQVRLDPSRLEDAIEEGVRWDTSTQCFARQTTTDIEISDQTIPADSRLIVLYASANRDKRVIPDPDRFDVDRKRVRHFGFGSGPHICLGAQTARHMLRVMLEELLPALNDYELDLSAAKRVQHLMVRGFSPASDKLVDMTKAEQTEAIESVPAAARRPQARARETGEKILAAALKEFAEHGFAGTSTRAVATAAGVQHPLVNYHFKSKEGLWHAVLEATAGQFIDQFQARLAGLRGVDDVTKLQLVQEDFIRFSAENPHFHLLMSQAGQHPSKQLNALVNEFVRPYFTTISALIRSAQRAGAYVEGDPEHLQYLFIGATTRIFTLSAEVKLITGASPFSGAMLERHVAACLELFFRPSTEQATGANSRRKR